MRNACFGLLLIGFLSITSASELRAQSSSTAASPAPVARIYYLTQSGYFETNVGVYGFGTGTQFDLVQDFGDGKLRVKNGNYELDIPASLVTTDLEIARQAWENEVARLKQRPEQQQQVAEQAAQQQRQIAREREATALLQAEQDWQDRQVALQEQAAQRHQAALERQAALQRQAELDLQQGAQQQQEEETVNDHVRNELDQLERRLSSAHEPLSSSERASYQNGLGNEVHRAGDSNLENRFQEALRKDDDERRQQDYEYNKQATEKFDPRP